MIKRIALTALAALAIMNGASAQDDRNSYFWSDGRQVRVDLAPNLVALRFSVTPNEELIGSIGRANNLAATTDERYSSLRAHRVVVYSVLAAPQLSNRYLTELQNELTRSGAPVADVGRLVTTETGALAVLTEHLSIGFVDGVSGLGDLRGLDVEPLVSVVRTLNARPLVVSYRVNADSPRTALEIANEVYEYRDGGGRRLVTYASPTLRFPMELRAVPNQPLHPNDTYYVSGAQWHLNSPPPSADVDAPEAWDYTRGSSDMPTTGCRVTKRVRIAVFDIGVETTHPDLIDNISPDGRDYTLPSPGNNPNPDPFDAVTNPDPRHGTQAAGVIAACGNNSIGVSGICPLCEILPIKLNTITAENFLEALYDAADPDDLKADVMSNSWGVPTTDPFRIALNIITGTDPPAAGIPIFFAVQDQNEDWCGCGPGEKCDISGVAGVIGVSGSSSADKAGLIGGFGSCVDLVAPTQKDQVLAGNIVTTDLTTELIYTNSSNGFGGTSSSTALAAGIAGLVLSLNPGLRQQDVRNILQHTAEKIEPLPPGNAYDSNGFSPRAGYGRVNAHRAVVPVVKIAARIGATSTSNITVQVNQPFDITISASAPYLLSAIGWSREVPSCPDQVEQWRSVNNKAFHEETWSGLTLASPGTYIYQPNAKDTLYPAVDEYPHIASDAFPTLPKVTVQVQGAGAPASCTVPNPPTNLHAEP